MPWTNSSAGGDPDVDETEIVLGDRAEVMTTGHSDPVAASKAAREILEMAQEITDPEVKDGYFD